jgi:hypothetical protein
MLPSKVNLSLPLSFSLKLHVSLLLLYNNNLVPGLKPPTFSVITIILLLGKKYIIRHLAENAISRLRAEYFFDMDAFDQDDNWTQIQEPENPASADLMFLECANIARESSLLDLLPSLFVYLLKVDVKDIIKGLPRADGSCALLSLPNQHSWILGFEALVRGDLRVSSNATISWMSGPWCLHYVQSKTNSGICSPANHFSSSRTMA